jgi:hypothetical protein
VERRFQNPGQKRPITAPSGTVPILLGIWEDAAAPVLVGMDANSRIGRETRFSLFVPLHLLQSAQNKGWAEHFSESGERIIAFSPTLLPIYVALVQGNLEIDPSAVASVLSAAGIVNREDEAAERARRTVAVMIRDAAFSKTVRESYGGLCAMCGLNHSLVVGAHIFPVEAQGAPDKVWNGIALCHNHHAAFDTHRIFVHPTDRTIYFHPELHEGASRNTASQSFIECTFKRLEEPLATSNRPRTEMFDKRYSYFEAKYAWV